MIVQLTDKHGAEMTATYIEPAILLRDDQRVLSIMLFKKDVEHPNFKAWFEDARGKMIFEREMSEEVK